MAEPDGEIASDGVRWISRLEIRCEAGSTIDNRFKGGAADRWLQLVRAQVIAEQATPAMMSHVSGALFRESAATVSAGALVNPTRKSAA
jgi:hypothetical protein